MSIRSCGRSSWLGRAPHTTCPTGTSGPISEQPLLTPIKVKNCKNHLMPLWYPRLLGNELFTADCKVSLDARSPTSKPTDAHCQAGDMPWHTAVPQNMARLLVGYRQSWGKHQTSPAPHSTPSSAEGDISAPKPNPHGPCWVSTQRWM